MASLQLITNLRGPQGPSGVQYLGAWNAATSYAISDMVVHDSRLWVAASPHSNVEPGTDGAIWGEVSTGAHGDLTGLSADDHPQYLTQARGDARYAPLGLNMPWTDITLASGFEANPGTGDVAVRVINDVAYMQGLIRRTGGTAMEASTSYTVADSGGIPAAARPVATGWFAGGSTTGQSPVTVVVLSNGGIQFRVGPSNISYAGLASAVYPVS